MRRPLLLDHAPPVLLAAALTAIAPTPASAQDEWGKVSHDDLLATSYADLPKEDAVILFDNGSLTLTSRGELRYRRHERIKILTAAGISAQADVKIPHSGRFEIVRLDAHTILPGGATIPVDHVYEQGVDELRMKVFTFPSLEPGCVVEYRYEAKTRELPTWYFQNDAYTRVSHFELSYPSVLHVTGLMTGLAEKSPNQTTSMINDPDNTEQKLVQYVWELRDVSPLRAEPFMPDGEDYRTAVRFDLKFESEGWKDVGKWLRKSHEAFLKKDGGADAWVKEKIDGISDPLGRARAIYAGLRDDFQPVSSQPAPESLEEVLKTRAANSNERNLVLADALRRAGVSAVPVYISTRDHGRFHPEYSPFSQLNLLIARADIQGQTYLMDANDAHCPFGLLPPNDLVKNGLLAGNGKCEVVSLDPPRVESLRSVESTFAIADDGSATAHSRIEYTGLRAIGVRGRVTKEGEQSVGSAILHDRFPNGVLDSLKASSVGDADVPLVLELWYHVPGFAQSAPPLMLVPSPHLYRLQSNLFPAETRKLPVDFGFATRSIERAELTWPPGFVLSQIPPPARADIRVLSFERTCVATGGALQATRALDVRDPWLEPDRYQDLRDFYSRVVAADQVQAVLRRSP